MSQAAIPIDNKVAALMRAGSTAFANADVDVGEGLQGEWPPAGDHDLYILGVTEKVGDYKDGDLKVPCVEVQFEFEWIRDPNDPTWDKVKDPGPLHFKGRSFRLVPNPDKDLVSDGAKTGARMDWERFKGHLTKILGITKDQCADPMARYAEVKGLIAGSTRVAVSAKLNYREWTSKDGKKKGVEKKEYITGNITG